MRATMFCCNVYPRIEVLITVLVLMIIITLCTLIILISYSYPNSKQQDASRKYLQRLTTIRKTPSLPPYHIKDLTGSDPSALIDLSDFHYVINNLLCNHTASLTLLVLVVSATEHREQRSTIRRTWGQLDRRHRLLFLLGAVNSIRTEYQKQIDVENNLHRDIIQGSFTDTYRNLTYKHVMALKWTTHYCPNARYVLKVDDDMFVNMPALLDHFDRVSPRRQPRNLILCKIAHKHIAHRRRSKWRVTLMEYPSFRYPTFCYGYVVLYSADVVTLLYLEAQRTPYFWLEDVHVTGTLVERVNLMANNLLKHSHVGSLMLTPKQVTAMLKTKKMEKKFLFTSEGLKRADIQQLWDITQSRR